MMSRYGHVVTPAVGDAQWGEHLGGKNAAKNLAASNLRERGVLRNIQRDIGKDKYYVAGDVNHSKRQFQLRMDNLMRRAQREQDKRTRQIERMAEEREKREKRKKIPATKPTFGFGLSIGIPGIEDIDVGGESGKAEEDDDLAGLIEEIAKAGDKADVEEVSQIDKLLGHLDNPAVFDDDVDAPQDTGPTPIPPSSARARSRPESRGRSAKAASKSPQGTRHTERSLPVLRYVIRAASRLNLLRAASKTKLSQPAITEDTCSDEADDTRRPSRVEKLTKRLSITATPDRLRQMITRIPTQAHFRAILALTSTKQHRRDPFLENYYKASYALPPVASVKHRGFQTRNLERNALDQVTMPSLTSHDDWNTLKNCRYLRYSKRFYNEKDIVALNLY